MDEFLKLDWTPKSEDILTGPYVSEERLKKESATQKLLLGSFINPFGNVRVQNTQDAIKLDSNKPVSKSETESESKPTN